MNWQRLKFWQNGVKPTPTKLVYTDKAKNKYYTFKNPAEIPHGRWMDAQILQRYAEFCLTKEQFSMWLDRMEESINQKQPDIASLGALVKVARASEELYCEKETVLNLATVYFMMNDEDPETYMDYWQKAKREAWGKDKGAESFFLQQCVLLIPMSAEQRNSNVLRYIQKTKPVIDELNYHLTQSRKSTDGSKPTESGS